jgi:Ankyrin repeats (many copies)
MECKGSLIRHVTMISHNTCRFRWAFCQLETLRHCYPANLQDTLLELPESLDDTYKRTLSGIERAKREFAYRLFQCLTVSNGPLRVEELADLLAIRFDSQKRPIYHVDFRLKDAHEAVLSTCSSLIAIVNVDDTPMVQFAHFSVKEYLISDRLAIAGPDLSPYHVDPQLAHTMLAQVSLSVLLGLDKVDKKSMKHFPLAIYAAWHWVAHAQFEDVSASIENEMDRLFDPNKPYFATWVWIYDIDYPFREHMFTDNPLDARPEAVPLYYATLCGFYSLAKRIILKHPRDVNARGGYHVTPFHAALAKGNTQIALLLLDHGADINALDNDDLSPLHKSSRGGRCDVAEFLIEHRANVNKQNQLYGQTLGCMHGGA